MAKRTKQYDIVYRKRRDKDSPLQFFIMDGTNIDDAKRKFWEDIQKFDMYGDPEYTLVNVSLRKNKKITLG